MGIKFTNNAEGDLFAGITAIATTMTLNAGQGDLFPVIGVASGDYFYGTLFDISGNREIVKCTERQAGSNVLTIVRGQDGTTGLAFSAADKFELRIPSIVFEEFDTDIVQNTADIASNLVLITDHGTRLSNIEDGVEKTGNKMYFYQNVAPTTGWTIDATIEDCLLGVKGGIYAFNVTGGNIAGSWSYSNHQHTGPNHSHNVTAVHSHTVPAISSHVHSTGDHTLTIAEMPSHTHGISGLSCSAGNGDAEASPGNNIFSNPTGGGLPHNHGNTGSAGGVSAGVTGDNSAGSTNNAGTGLTGAAAGPSTDRQRAAIGIIATKS